MTTVCTTDPEEAAAVLRRGGLVAFPTETVYGLGADAFAPEAVRAVFRAKERPADNPLIVHVASRAAVNALVRAVPPSARALMDHFFPGPLTLVLPRQAIVPDVVTAGLDTVGVRMPRHPVARAFLEAAGTPVAAPSANRSGRPSPTSWPWVHDDLDGRVDCILQGDRSEAGLESTVVDCTEELPVVLRAGAVTLEALRAVVPSVGGTAPTATHRRSPGTRHRHYAPEAQVLLVDDPHDAVAGPAHAYVGLEAPAVPAGFGLVLVCDDAAAYGHELFDFFRRADAAGCTRIYGQRAAPEGLGRALNDRLARAAQATAGASPASDG